MAGLPCVLQCLIFDFCEYWNSACLPLVCKHWRDCYHTWFSLFCAQVTKERVDRKENCNPIGCVIPMMEKVASGQTRQWVSKRLDDRLRNSMSQWHRTLLDEHLPPGTMAHVHRAHVHVLLSKGNRRWIQTYETYRSAPLVPQMTWSAEVPPGTRSFFFYGSTLYIRVPPSSYFVTLNSIRCDKDMGEQYKDDPESLRELLFRERTSRICSRSAGVLTGDGVDIIRYHFAHWHTLGPFYGGSKGSNIYEYDALRLGSENVRMVRSTYIDAVLQDFTFCSRVFVTKTLKGGIQPTDLKCFQDSGQGTSLEILPTWHSLPKYYVLSGSNDGPRPFFMCAATREKPRDVVILDRLNVVKTYPAAWRDRMASVHMGDALTISSGPSILALGMVRDLVFVLENEVLDVMPLDGKSVFRMQVPAPLQNECVSGRILFEYDREVIFCYTPYVWNRPKTKYHRTVNLLLKTTTGRHLSSEAPNWKQRFADVLKKRKTASTVREEKARDEKDSVGVK